MKQVSINLKELRSIPNVFYCNNGIKLEINNRKNLGKYLNIRKLNSTWFKETIQEIRKHFEVNENKNNVSQYIKIMCRM